MSEVTAEVVEATEGAKVAVEPRADGVPVEARLHERIGAFEEALERLRIAAGPEAIHDLRVAARRLTAFVRMWRALVPRACCRRIVRDARRLRRRAGRARDLEVEVGMLRERLARHDAPDADALRRLQEALGAVLDRAALRAALVARIGEPDNGRAARTLSSILSELDTERLEELQRLRATAAGFLRLAEAPTDAVRA
jgi:CHAD domain-containing protein